jgi:hypothetical protein
MGWIDALAHLWDRRTVLCLIVCAILLSAAVAVQ